MGTVSLIRGAYLQKLGEANPKKVKKLSIGGNGSVRWQGGDVAAAAAVNEAGPSGTDKAHKKKKTRSQRSSGKLSGAYFNAGSCACKLVRYTPLP